MTGQPENLCGARVKDISEPLWTEDSEYVAFSSVQPKCRMC